MAATTHSKLLLQVLFFAILGVYLASCRPYKHEKINECELGIGVCPENQTCADTDASWTCICAHGYRRKWMGNDPSLHCEDIDECKHHSVCKGETHCINTLGSYECHCNDGYRGDGVTCDDVNECEEGTHNCDPHAKCKNRVGDFKCRCRWGYEGNGTHCDVPHCVGGWKQTSDCMIAGDREPENDRACNETVPNGVSGWCECELERQVKMKCYHYPFTCDEACEYSRPEGEPPLDCQRFYRTANCDPEGPLLRGKTMSCDEDVRGGISGFCMCDDGRKASPVGCAHPTINCEKECEKLTRNETLKVDWNPDDQEWVEEEDVYLDMEGRVPDELDYNGLLKKVRAQQAQAEHDLRGFLDAHHQVHVLEKRQREVASDLWDYNEAMMPNETFGMLLHNFKRVEDEMNVLGMLLIQEGAWGGHEGLYLEEVPEWTAELAREMGSIGNEVYSLSRRMRSTELMLYKFKISRVSMLNRFIDADRQKLMRGGKYMLQQETRLGRCLTRSVLDLDPDFTSADSHTLGFYGCYHQTNASLAETKTAITTPERIMDETAYRTWEILPTRTQWGHASWVVRGATPEYIDEDDIKAIPKRHQEPTREELKERFGGDATRRWRERVKEHKEFQWKNRKQCIIQFYGTRVAVYPCDWGPVKEDLVHNDQGRWFVNTLTGGGGVWQLQRTPFKKKKKWDFTWDDRCFAAEDPVNRMHPCDEIHHTTYFATPVPDSYLWMGRYWAHEPNVTEPTPVPEGEEADVVFEDDLPVDMDAGDDDLEASGASADEEEPVMVDRLVDVYFVCDEESHGEAWWSAIDDALFLCDGTNWVPASEENLQLTDEDEGEIRHVLRSDLVESFYHSMQAKEKDKWRRDFTKWDHCRWRPEDHYVEALGAADDDEAHVMTLEERVQDVRRRVRKAEHDFNTMLDGFAHMATLAEKVNQLNEQIKEKIDTLAGHQYRVQRSLRKLAVVAADLYLAHAVAVRPEGPREPLPRPGYWDLDLDEAETDTFRVAQSEELRKLNLELYVLVMKYEAEKSHRFESLEVTNSTKLAQECAASSDNGLFVIRALTPDGTCLKSAYSLTEGPGKGVEMGECEFDENGEYVANSVWFLQHSLGSKWIMHPSDDWSRCMIMFTRSYEPGLFPCAWGWRKHKDVENEQGRWIIRYRPDTDAWTIMNRHLERCIVSTLDEVVECDNETAAWHVIPVARTGLRIGIAPPPPRIETDMYRVRNLTHLAIAPSDEITKNETSMPKSGFGWSKMDEVNETDFYQPSEEEMAELSEEELEKARELGTELSLPYTYDDEEYTEEQPINDAFAEGELWAIIKCNERNAGQMWWSRLDSWLFTCDGEFWLPAPGYILG